MSSALRLAAAIGLFCLGPAATAAAQGVPVLDGQAFAQRLEIFRHMERDEDSQVEKAGKRAAQKDFRQQQIDSIDAMLAAFESPSTFLAAMNAGDDLADGTPVPDAETLYGPLANPAAARVFGDAREDIEALIIRGASDTYALPGVGAAGLSPTQWRCLLQALIKQESRFQVGARSSASAFGLTQIMPDTARDLGIYPAYYEDPYLQVTGGARYLAAQLQRFDGNIVHALAAYNAGPGRVIEYGGVPPFAETQAYVQVIPRFYNEYLARIGGPDALGTIDPALYAAAGASLMAIGSAHYADHSMATARSALLRVRAIVERIGKTTSVKESYDLNTYMRAELIHITNQRIRLKAAKTKSLNAQHLAMLTRQREAEDFLADFTSAAFQE